LQEIRGVCTGVAGALHGLNEMGEAPSAVLVRVQNNQKNKKRHEPGESNDAKPTSHGVPWNN
jgi:hypothetical protein